MATYEARLSEFILDRAPAPGHCVEILCQDHVGTYTAPFLCRWSDDGWINCRTGEQVEADVLGWREAGDRLRTGAGPTRP